MNISEARSKAAAVLAEAGVSEHIRESSSLVQFALGRDLVFLYAHPDYELTQTEEARLSEFLGRRAGREPLQYITERQEFYGLDFLVSKDVLIPRPETEMIVAKGVDLLRQIDSPVFAEIGAGSGCISIAMLANVTELRGVAADISASALEIARINAVNNHVSERLKLIESDVFANFGTTRFHVIVSNPPYVPAADIDGLQPEVRNFEPRKALTDGADGLSILQRIIDGSPQFLLPGGCLLLEFGFGQAAAVESMFEPSNWKRVEILPDFQGIPRMAAAVIR